MPKKIQLLLKQNEQRGELLSKLKCAGTAGEEIQKCLTGPMPRGRRISQRCEVFTGFRNRYNKKLQDNSYENRKVRHDCTFDSTDNSEQFIAFHRVISFKANINTCSPFSTSINVALTQCIFNILHTIIRGSKSTL